MNLKKFTLLLAGAIALMMPTYANAEGKVNFTTPKKHPAAFVQPKAKPAVPNKTAYAWATRERSGIDKGIVSFSLATPEKLSSVLKISDSAYAGCYGNGKYYFNRYRNTSDSWEHIGLSTVDIKTGEIKDIKSWKDEYFVINDMSYDYTTGLIYAMARSFYMDDFLTALQFEYSLLMTINPTTGVTTTVKEFINWNDGALNNPTYYNLACDLNGKLYSVNQNGNLVTFDPDNDYAEINIGRTGLNPAKTTQSMEFDHTTGTLYWAADFKDQVAQLVVVDTGSGLASSIGETGSDAHLVGLYIPFEVPSMAAPGAVTNFIATPDVKGEKTISLSWTNPTKSYGGANLASISSVKVMRNEVEIASLTGTPGEKMEYTDNVPVDALYSYSIVAVNSAGKGLPSGLSRWVGKDVPMAVSTLGIGRNDDGTATLEWEEPTEGAHGGVIDTESLGYKITRFPDGTIVANDHKGSFFNDKTVPGTGRYYYTVESHTAQGVGEIAKTVEIALGSGISTYPWTTLFADASEFNLWTVVDCNGGSTWQWKSRTAGGYQAQAMYQYDNNTADDYLISPDLYMEKDARYKLKFAYAGANAYHTEKMALTFGKGKTAEAQSTVLQEFVMKDGNFRTFETELPEVAETGYYNFAFHAMSDPQMYNIYVTDVTVTQTVAAPEQPGDEYDFKVPANLSANIEEDGSTVTLTWDDSAVEPTKPTTSNIVENFDSMEKWTLNPEGSYGWTYIDGDGGIPYVDDYYEMPYPTDGKPLAAMVMAPYELHEFVYNSNPPHSGEQYLLFKSNYAAGNGSKPAPVPDDWFISPELNFGQDFIFRFWCKADPDTEGFGDPWNTEYFQVGYSKTDNNPDSFIWMTDEPEHVTTMSTEWVKKEYSLPADAKYVCIHYCTPQDGFWFMVDDVFIGIENAPASIQRKEKKVPTFRSYDVYVDDKKVASVTESKHTLLGLEDGQHVAKVFAVYEEGSSEAAVVAFSTKTSGVETVISDNVLVYPNPASEMVFFGKEVEKATLFNMAGATLSIVYGADSMNLNAVPAGIYLLKLDNNAKTQTVRLIVK